MESWTPEGYGTPISALREAFEEYFYGGLPIQGDDLAEVLRYGSAHRGTDYEVDYSMAAVARLKDGRFAAINGGFSCETGWSCQAGLYATIHATEQEAWDDIGTDDRAMIERAEVGA